jgi:hypothetical protein
VQPCDEDEEKDDQFFFLFFRVMEHRWNEIDRGKPKYSGKTCPSATLSTTNPTWTDPGSNPGLRVGRQTTNRLSHGTELGYDVASMSKNIPTFPRQNIFIFLQG